MKEATPAILLVVIAVATGAVVYFYMGALTPAPAVETQSASATVAVPVPFTELAHGTHSSVSERTNYVIKSSAELAQLWKMVDAKGAAPAVDFSTNSVIAVFAGQEPTLGYSIAISKIEDNTERTVSVVLTKPGGSCVVGQLVTAPYQIVVVPQTTLPLAHNDAVTITSCLQ